MPLPLALLPVPRQRFWTQNGKEPLAGGLLQFFTTGTSTPQAVFSDPQGEVTLGVEVELDMYGYAPAIYISPIGYRVVLLGPETTAGRVQQWAVDGVEDVASAFLATWGQSQAEGAKGVTSGYEITKDDNFVTVNDTLTDPALIYLQPASHRGAPITIKNIGPKPMLIKRFGSDTIESLSADYLVAPGTPPDPEASPQPPRFFPTLTLISDGVSAYWIQSSHGLPNEEAPEEEVEV